MGISQVYRFINEPCIRRMLFVFCLLFLAFPIARSSPVQFDTSSSSQESILPLIETRNYPASNSNQNLNLNSNANPLSPLVNPPTTPSFVNRQSSGVSRKASLAEIAAELDIDDTETSRAQRLPKIFPAYRSENTPSFKLSNGKSYWVSDNPMGIAYDFEHEKIQKGRLVEAIDYALSLMLKMSQPFLHREINETIRQALNEIAAEDFGKMLEEFAHDLFQGRVRGSDPMSKAVNPRLYSVVDFMTGGLLNTTYNQIIHDFGSEISVGIKDTIERASFVSSYKIAEYFHQSGTTQKPRKLDNESRYEIGLERTSFCEDFDIEPLERTESGSDISSFRRHRLHRRRLVFDCFGFDENGRERKTCTEEEVTRKTAFNPQRLFGNGTAFGSRLWNITRLSVGQARNTSALNATINIMLAAFRPFRNWVSTLTDKIVDHSIWSGVYYEVHKSSLETVGNIRQRIQNRLPSQLASIVNIVDHSLPEEFKSKNHAEVKQLLEMERNRWKSRKWWQIHLYKEKEPLLNKDLSDCEYKRTMQFLRENAALNNNNNNNNNNTGPSSRRTSFSSTTTPSTSVNRLNPSESTSSLSSLESCSISYPNGLSVSTSTAFSRVWRTIAGIIPQRAMYPMTFIYNFINTITERILKIFHRILSEVRKRVEIWIMMMISFFTKERVRKRTFGMYNPEHNVRFRLKTVLGYLNLYEVVFGKMEVLTGLDEQETAEWIEEWHQRMSLAANN